MTTSTILTASPSSQPVALRTTPSPTIPTTSGEETKHEMDTYTGHADGEYENAQPAVENRSPMLRILLIVISPMSLLLTDRTTTDKFQKQFLEFLKKLQEILKALLHPEEDDDDNKPHLAKTTQSIPPAEATQVPEEKEDNDNYDKEILPAPAPVEEEAPAPLGTPRFDSVIV